MRWPNDFYRDFEKHRNKYGEEEYDELVMLRGFLPIFKRYLTEDKDQAENIMLALLSDVEIGARKKRDPKQRAFEFMYEDHVALGARMRIKRGCMNQSHHNQRRNIIDDNKYAQDEAWKEESLWLRKGSEALDGSPDGTKRRDVLNEDGSPKRPEAAE